MNPVKVKHVGHMLSSEFDASEAVESIFVLFLHSTCHNSLSP